MQGGGILFLKTRPCHVLPLEKQGTVMQRGKKIMLSLWKFGIYLGMMIFFYGKLLRIELYFDCFPM
jgi:hypothetical protein